MTDHTHENHEIADTIEEYLQISRLRHPGMQDESKDARLFVVAVEAFDAYIHQLLEEHPDWTRDEAIEIALDGLTENIEINHENRQRLMDPVG